MRVFGRKPLDLEQTVVPGGNIYLITERCKGCRLCVVFCPRQVLRESSSINGKGYHLPEVIPGRGGACVHCEFCSLLCPEFAIFTVEASG